MVGGWLVGIYRIVSKSNYNKPTVYSKYCVRRRSQIKREASSSRAGTYNVRLTHRDVSFSFSPLSLGPHIYIYIEKNRERTRPHPCLYRKPQRRRSSSSSSSSSVLFSNSVAIESHRFSFLPLNSHITLLIQTPLQKEKKRKREREIN